MGSYKKLLLNSGVFAIGNLGSKLIQFVLVPLYTYHLSTQEYGTVDLVVTTTNLLLPIFSANIFEAVLRFTMDQSEKKSTILTNSLFASIIGILLLIFVTPSLIFFGFPSSLVSYISLILSLQIIQSCLVQFTRAIGKVKKYAINGILMTFITGVSNVILLTVFNLGINGYLLSIIFANLGSIIFIFFSVKIWNYIQIYSIDFYILRKMLQYCLPMIPNSIMWWLINASNRYFILFFVGASANGIYAVASKIPSILSLLNSIFGQAWQLSAIEEYKNKEKSTFYSNVFDLYSSLFFLGTSFIIIISKVFMKNFVAPEYYEGWKLIPFLLLSVTFSSFSGFLGTNYVAAKQTKGVFKTSIYGGLSSLILNFLFVPYLGIIGSALASMISFFIMWILRIIDTKKYITLKINPKKIVLNILFICVQIFSLFVISIQSVQLLTGLIIFGIQIYFDSSILTLSQRLKGAKKE